METRTLTENGISVTKGFGEEKYLKCCLGAFRGTVYYQYDYRHLNGELFFNLALHVGAVQAGTGRVAAKENGRFFGTPY